MREEPQATRWTYILFFPFTAALGSTLWNQWDVFDEMFEHSWNGKMCFVMFLLALCAAVFDFGTILGKNLPPFASNITACMPMVFNFFRGMRLYC
ncbi:hypothetical protein SCP_1502350 [Sparassis crispa]|uniref:Uncharacterized protein n=1 Tax=Sparassis crispa TaxID=139825 RepID=A0A401H466_9APHY|nr:hypothetical protein SCP_1502350 [Sparassis crispa]GBE89227.1 hypothetical protein SCP_1502350 [Sparassis crispa]